jgi:hypothetical protein
MELSPLVTGRRRGVWLRFGILIAIGFIWAYSTRGMPGSEGDGDSICCCPVCFEFGDNLVGPLYRCKNGHDFSAEMAAQGRMMKEKKEEEEKEDERK